ncbi:tetratricopeptide repeat protein [Pseudoalteromonas sp. C2R02]|uniref:tetratricopeptide repeat protein n=1 Tax=Pseudoalteromonas sp. C2R02 TaxID=2841565 RepID=UPI001C088DB4|nr:tetratricopeptide repeat protein [Pseudoalteromonas sp. C2R02]MBU2971322.1 tetratricopeptide repeat protein [Pseudoalteromonas sp. C2R02]
MPIKTNSFKISLLIIITQFILAGCANTKSSAQASPPPLTLFSNQTQFKDFEVESYDEIFELSDELKAQLVKNIPNKKPSMKTAKDLLHFIFNSANNNLDYQSGATLTANQTFKQQNANCLSLSIMAFSMAEHLGLEANFQRVFIPEYWALENGFNLLTSHINLKLQFDQTKFDGVQRLYDVSDGVVVDFDANSRKEKFKTKEINKHTVAAMFYNNKGAIAMVNGRYNEAYHYLKSATKIASRYSPAWGNLGILFRIKNQNSHAELAYQYALELDPANNTAKGNLGILFEMTDRIEQAQVIKRELDAKRQSNPYYHIAKGNEAYVQKFYREAISYYKKSTELDRKLHEPYFGLARSFYQLGDYKKAKRYLKSAKKNAFFIEDINSYQGKINSLNAMVN